MLSDIYNSAIQYDNIYVVSDDKGNRSLIDQNGNVLEKVIDSYEDYKSGTDDDAYIIAEVSKDTYVLYDCVRAKKISTFSGKSVSLYEHYFIVDENYYSYKNGKQFYSKN